MFKNKRSLILTVVLILILIALFTFDSTSASAQTALQQVGQAAGLPDTDIRVIIAKIIRAVLGTMGIILLVLIIYGGFVWMTSGGDPAKIKTAQAIIKNAIIGFVIVMSSYAIASFVLTSLLGGGGGVGSRGGVGGGGTIDPLSGALGLGPIQDHYPPRFAVGVPRNTKIIITFKMPIQIASMTNGILNEGDTAIIADNKWQLNSNNVSISYNDDDGDDIILASEEVEVRATEDLKTWVLDPVGLLGSSTDNVNYKVVLSGIKDSGGADIFYGAFSNGYSWTFEVSTFVDLTPPKILNFLPADGSNPDRNIVVQVNFNEPIDPTSASGIYDLTDDAPEFSNLTLRAGNTIVAGSWKVSNGYKTTEFVSFDECGEDPCGDTIFCLPGGAQINATAFAATISTDNPPEAAGFPYDGIVDVASNSLDGNGDGTASGPVSTGGNDDFSWDFTTTNIVNDEPPKIHDIIPESLASEVAQDAPVRITFENNVPILASSLTSENVLLAPSPSHEMWFSPRAVSLGVNYQELAGTAGDIISATRLDIAHGIFLKTIDPLNPQDYYYSISNGVKSAYQICFYPAVGPQCETGLDDDIPSCCDGIATSTCVIPQ